MLAAFAHSTGWLIGCRVIQGIGIGGLTALVQVILSDLVSPRERGRYSGYLGATFGVGTVVGPLLGGVVTDGLGWRWCFAIGVPFAIAAFVVLQRTLHLPRRRREVRIDVVGATLIAAGVSALLIWVSLAGQQFAWASWQTAALVARRRRAPARRRARRAARARADHPAAAVRRAHRGARRDRQRRRRHRDVRHDRLPQPVHADRARQVADGVRPADHPDGRRPVRRLDRRSGGSSAAPASTSAGCCSARRCSRSAWPDGHDRRDAPAWSSSAASCSSSAPASAC